MVNYSRPGVTGKMIEEACNIRALHSYVRGARYREERLGELPSRWTVNYFLKLAKYEPPVHLAKAHVKLMAHVHRWAADPALPDTAPPTPYLLQQTPAG